jgi:predicted dehydrogenase
MAINSENGHIRWDYETGVAEIFNSDTNTWKKIQPPEKFERNHLFLDEMRHFIDLCAHDGASRCDLSDGIRALQLTEAIHRSGAGGCQIVV